MTVGPVVVAAGLALLSRAGGGHGYLLDVLPAVTVLGLGLATTVAPLTSTALGAVPAEHAGVASAVNNDVARTAQLLAVAVLPAVAGLSGAAYLNPGVFNDGFRTAMWVAAGICAAGGLAAGLGIRNPARPPVPAVPAPGPAGAGVAQPVPAASTAPAAAVPGGAPVQCLHCALDAPPAVTTASAVPARE
jgi:hypothetical protein